MKSTIAIVGTVVLLGAALSFTNDTIHETSRSTHWPKVRLEYLKDHSTCAICGIKTQLEVHHVKSFHLHPELELESTNLITLCTSPSCKSHLTIGHLGNYQLNNPSIREDAALLKSRRDDARKQ